MDDDKEVDSYWSLTTGLGLSLKLEKDEGGQPVIVIGGGATEYRFRRVS